MAKFESSKLTCCYMICPIDCLTLSRVWTKLLLNACLVYWSSFSYFWRRVFWGPRWYLVLPALTILFFPPFPETRCGVTELICSTTFDLGYISSMTEKKPAIFALCPGTTLRCSMKSSRYAALKSANLYTSYPYPRSVIFKVYYYSLNAFNS